MLYYDLEQNSLLDSHVKSFDVALAPLRPPFISPVNTKAYRQFILLAKKLYRLKVSSNVTIKEIELLSELIEQTNQVGCKNWLKMRVKALLVEKNVPVVL